MQATRILVCVAAAAAVGACVAEPGDGGFAGGDDDDGAGGVIEAQLGGAGDPCPPDGCGGNSPVMDGVYFWRLHVGGKPNPEGVRITGVKDVNEMKMKLEAVAAEGDRLRGVSLANPLEVRETTGLIGTRIALSYDEKPYEILITWVAPDERFWSVDGAQPIESYQLQYRALSGGDYSFHPLCSEDDLNPSSLRALIFTGDLYSPKTKKIVVGAETNGWLNIACEGSAIYKMHKIGYTTAAQGRLGIETTVPQRRAMLNAWTSNVCGTGRSFTQQGELITLKESLAIQLSSSPYQATSETLESIWSETGAVCLDTHRREEDEPSIYKDIAQECINHPLPSCADYWGDWQAYGTVVTGNPPSIPPQ